MFNLRFITTLFIFTFSFSAISKVEELYYDTLKSDGKFEIREYASYLKATVTLKEKDSYKTIGFKILFKYISGENNYQQQIDMTAPVLLDEGIEINMTAPVILDENESTNQYSISFVMPSTFTLDTLPIPKDKRIKISEVSKGIKAVAKFSGFMWDYKVRKHTQDLLEWLRESEYKASGKPLKAGYNSPWTLPFLRRNEILLDVELK